MGATRSQVQSFLTDQQAYSLHKPARKNFERNHTYVGGIDRQWQADLVDMQKLSRFNKGYKYILTCIDIFSKYAWAIPVKDKSSMGMIAGFRELFRQAAPRVPERLQTDKGKEFLAKPVQKLLSEYNIKHFVSNSDMKAAVVERFNRTLKEKMWTRFYDQNTKNYVGSLAEHMSAYNSSPHRSIRMAPSDVTKEHEDAIWVRLYGDGSTRNGAAAELEPGQKVRVSRWKGQFEKGYKPRWSEEHFNVKKVAAHPRRMYEIVDYSGEPVEGQFYDAEVQPIRKNIYTVEKVLAKRKLKGRAQILVKWRGWPEKFNSWQFEDEFN